MRETYLSHCSRVVESIRVMLYASGTAKKDSPALESNELLKKYHRLIVMNLAKLVTLAKVAAGLWPPPDSGVNLHKITREILLSVRHFTLIADEMDIPLDEECLQNSSLMDVKPQFIHTPLTANPSTIHSPSKIGSSFGLMKCIETALQSIIHAHSDLCSVIDGEMVDSHKLIGHIRILVTEVGSLMSYVDEIPHTVLQTSEILVNFKVNRLAMYNSISGLVMATQMATSALAPPNALAQVSLNANIAEQSAKDLVVSSKFLLEEIDNLELNRLEKHLTQVQSPVSDTSSTKMLAEQVPSPTSPIVYRIDVNTGSTASTSRFNRDSTLGSSSSSSKYMTSSEVPWFLETKYPDAEILKSENGKIKAATLKMLVEILTSHDRPGKLPCILHLWLML